MRSHRIWKLLLVFPLVWTGAVLGCRSTQPAAASQPASTREEARMEDALADSDAERAKAALERNQRTGERRPAVPERPPTVDQPRPPR